MTTLEASIIAKVRKDLKTFSNDALVKWFSETESATLKVIIKEELDTRYWNNKGDVEPWARDEGF